MGWPALVGLALSIASSVKQAQDAKNSQNTNPFGELSEYYDPNRFQINTGSNQYQAAAGIDFLNRLLGLIKK